MMKVLLTIFFMFFMIFYNKMISFYYNSLFILSLFFFCYMNMDEWIMKSISLYNMVDYYSFMLILLSFWVIGLMLMTLDDYSKLKKAMFLMMMLILFFFFSVSNILLFYFFFELSLIPTFMLIIYWGYNPERLSAAYYMLMYTLLISLPLLIYIFKIYMATNSFNFMLIFNMSLNLSFWGFMILMGAFMVKMPIFLFHIWLPKAHVEAPVYGSMILAAILLKLGSYGFLRFLIIFLESSFKFNSIMISIGITGSFFMSLVCLVQIDLKSLVAYSSVVHMNLMMSELMSFYKVGYVSSYMIMISHGLCSSGLFYMVNLYYYRSSSRLLMFNKGMMNIIPSFSLWWFLLCSSNFSFPFSLSFISEIYLMGVLISWDWMIMFYLILVSFLSSAYSLYLFIYIQHGESMNMKLFNSGVFKEFYVMILHYLPMILFLMNLIVF